MFKLLACVATKNPGSIHESVTRRFHNNTLMISSEPGWANAANSLLDRAARRKDIDGVLFLDDDIQLTDTSLELLPKYRHQADIIGFSLFKPTPSGLIPQSCGHQFVPHNGSVVLIPLSSAADMLTPLYCAHVTASCVYINRNILRAGIRFPVWDGEHYEDVVFTIRAWMHGFKVAYVPGLVIHHFGQTAGRTKEADSNFDQKRNKNLQQLLSWYKEINLVDLCVRGVVPLGAQKIELTT